MVEWDLIIEIFDMENYHVSNPISLLAQIAIYKSALNMNPGDYKTATF